MHLYFSEDFFEYSHPVLKNKRTTTQKIPFLINNKGKLEDLPNFYLLVKTEDYWNGKVNTINTNAQHIKYYLDYLETNQIKIDNAQYDVINSYIEYLKNKKLKENTIKNKILSVKSMYDWLYNFKFVNQNPFQIYSNNFVNRKINSFSKNNSIKNFQINELKRKLIKDIKTEDIPSPEQVKNIYKNLSQEYKLIFLLYLTTGMRKKELIQLTPDMIIQAKDNGDSLSYSLFLDANKINIKNSKSRIVILDGFLRNKLIKHLRSKEYKKRLKLYQSKHNNEAPLFISKQGNYYASNTINNNLKLANETNFNITVHSLRHYYATNFIRYKEKSGADIENAYLYLSERLGHSNADITKEYYIKVVNKLEQQKVMENFSSNLIEGLINE